MLDAIQKLLILQERDRQLGQVEAELSAIGPQRAALLAAVQSSGAGAELARQRVLHLESDRKKLELEVVARQQQIEKYSLQQFQTKKNEEYQALAHEIETCKAEIRRLDDQQLELMEQAEQAQHAALAAGRGAEERRQENARQVGLLDEREANLRRQQATLKTGRDELAAAVLEADLLDRYDRLRRTKSTAVASVEHSACGGCHMKLPAQVVLTARGSQEVASCPNCGRLLYFIAGMDLAISD